MARATRILGRGGWSGEPADTVVLGYDGRRRREGALTGVRGLAFDLALEEPLTMRGGDALALDDGRIVEVVAAPEPLLELRPGAADELARLAWMLGDRHAPIQIVGQKLRLRDDPALKAVADHLGVKATPIEAPFDPEGGAYAPETAVELEHEHGHDHGHACGCGHHHGHHHHEHGHAHAAAHDHAHDHAHGDSCCGGQGHKHDHKHGHKHGHKHDHDHAHGEGGCGGSGGCGCGGKG
jgi:urease accessory protein